MNSLHFHYPGDKLADPTQFDHDRISHLLADRLLEVPSFQRRYSWDEGNVSDFLTDLETARHKNSSYFLGTVVFANSNENPQRQQIVDGQQRLATTAILLVAIRDLLNDHKKQKQAKHIDETYLRGYDLEAEDYVERIILNPDDQPQYDALLARTPLETSDQSAIAVCYRTCIEYLRGLAPSEADYKKLIEITTQLDESVQVLVAVASDLPEAYVIFETLNDRGADLTTADLLKNYLFSQSRQNFAFVQSAWTKISNDFEKSLEFVKFIRFDYMSRNGHVTTRNLYKAMQDDIGAGPIKAKAYLARLERARVVYTSLKDQDSQLWNSLAFDMRDAVLALRRFGLESGYPLLLAAFEKWPKDRAAKLFLKVINWSIRALYAGKLGGSVAEKAFSIAAKDISDGHSTTQDHVKAKLSSLIVDDAEFISDFGKYGNVGVTRARYLLAMLERAKRTSLGKTLDGLPDWSSRTVTLEHLMPRAEAKGDEVKASYVETLANMALLEKQLNHSLDNKPFLAKAPTYAQSVFVVTSELQAQTSWTQSDVAKRGDELAALAAKAWEL